MDCRDSWTELFDVVIAKANKPQFYTSEHPFRFVSHSCNFIICDMELVFYSNLILLILVQVYFLVKDIWGSHCATDLLFIFIKNIIKLTSGLDHLNLAFFTIK